MTTTTPPQSEALDRPPVVVDPDYPLERVPAARRRGPAAVTIVMAGFCFFTPTMVTGGQVAGALDFPVFLAAAAAASLILAVYIGALGLIAARTGLSTVLTARLVLGRAGGKWASILLGGTQVGWYGITIAVLGDLFGAALGWETTWPVVVAGGVLMAVTAYRGFRGIELLSWISVPLMLVLCAWMTVRSFDEAGGWAGLLGTSGDGSMPLATAMTMLVATFVSGGTQVGNWARFSTPRMSSFWMIVAGVGVIQAAMLFFGGVGSAAFGIPDFSELLLSMGLVGVGLLLVVANLWTTNDNTAYAYGVAGAELFGKNDKRPFVVGGTAIGILLAVTGLGDAIGSFLTVLGTLIPPLGGVIIGTFLLVWKGRDPGTPVDAAPMVVWPGVVAYVLGVATAVVTNELAVGIPPLQGLLVAAVAAPVATALTARPARPAQENR
ncbi:cytosine permease [Puerhibacterium sp. TATVAM-FAB25]|uniref:cytosine permease n=1 Tax=Puerhibacterium sp. TATVAM-FAB25 TaxID=3093699 RepID=UPI0039783BC3